MSKPSSAAALLDLLCCALGAVMILMIVFIISVEARNEEDDRVEPGDVIVMLQLPVDSSLKGQIELVKEKSGNQKNTTFQYEEIFNTAAKVDKQGLAFLRIRGFKGTAVVNFQVHKNAQQIRHRESLSSELKELVNGLKEVSENIVPDADLKLKSESLIKGLKKLDHVSLIQEVEELMKIIKLSEESPLVLSIIHERLSIVLKGLNENKSTESTVGKFIVFQNGSSIPPTPHKLILEPNAVEKKLGTIVQSGKEEAVMVLIEGDT